MATPGAVSSHRGIGVLPTPSAPAIPQSEVRTDSSLAAELLAHAVVVVEHGLVAGQVELVVVRRVLAKRDGPVLVHDASDLDDLPGSQAEPEAPPLPGPRHVVGSSPGGSGALEVGNSSRKS